jgi:hypothetical protein
MVTVALVSVRPAQESEVRVRVRSAIAPAMASMAGRLSSMRSRTGSESPDGSPSTPPSPSGPWISGSCLAGRMSGTAAPPYTLMCAGAANACKHRAAFILVFSAVAFPCTLRIDQRGPYGYTIRTSYGRNAEKMYIFTMKCQQDGSGIIVSLASRTGEKGRTKSSSETYRITIEPDVVHRNQKKRYLSDSNTRGQSPTAECKVI